MRKHTKENIQKAIDNLNAVLAASTMPGVFNMSDIKVYEILEEIALEMRSIVILKDEEIESTKRVCFQDEDYGTGPFKVLRQNDDGSVTIELTVGEEAHMNGDIEVDDDLVEVEVEIPFEDIDWETLHLTRNEIV